MSESWQIWAKTPQVEGTLVKRAKNELPQMESTKQLVSLIRECYRPGDTILDVGCNVGHYLRGILEVDSQIKYMGVDAYEYYISQAQKIYQEFKNTKFMVKDIFKPLFPENKFDIVYCCNVLIHLPEFQTPIKNLLESTKKVCFIRTLVGPQTVLVQRSEDEMFDENFKPTKYINQNTYGETTMKKYIESLGWKVEFIEDAFNPKIIADELSPLKAGRGTGIIDGKQVDGNIIFNWKFLKITK